MRRGINESHGDILLIQDADLEYSPSDIPALIAPLLDGKADAVFGTRLRGGAHPQRAHLFWHYAGNRFLTLLSNVLYNTTISDMEVGYKAFHGDLVRGLELISDDFRIEPELTAKILRLRPADPPLRGPDRLLRPLLRRGQEDHVARRLRRRRRADPLPLLLAVAARHARAWSYVVRGDPRTPLHCRSFIGGEFRSGHERFERRNPVDGEVVATADLADEATVDAAVAAAKDAFASWRRTTGFERGHLLRELARIALERLDDLATSMTLEMGKPLDEARGEVRKFAQAMRFYAEEAERIGGETIPNESTEFLSVVHKEPVGVVAAITPWNYPVELVGWKLGGALGAGCTMVLKASEYTPGAVQLLAECIRDAGFPPGVVNAVHGPGHGRARCSPRTRAWPRSPSRAPTPPGRSSSRRSRA